MSIQIARGKQKIQHEERMTTMGDWNAVDTLTVGWKFQQLLIFILKHE